MPVHLPACITSAPYEQIFVEFDAGDFHLNLSIQSKCCYSQKYQAHYMKTQVWFIAAADKIAMKALSSGELGSGC